QLSVGTIDGAIHLDGQLDEAAWQTVAPATSFQMNQPFDSLPAQLDTEVRMLQDDQMLYIGAICRTFPKKDFVIQSLKRDFNLWQNESLAIFLDVFSDANSGLVFAVNPWGVQMDAIIPRGGTRTLSLSWDALWHAEVHRDRASGYWSVEIAIPFKTLRFKKGNRDWRANFARVDMQSNQYSSWRPVPRGFNIFTLAYMGSVHLAKAPTKTSANVSLIPYGAMKLFHEHRNGQDLTNLKPAVGVDAKVGITSSLNLDLTVNPDFSQVEVDDQVIDLSRFEISFPEKRIFFLENSDLFASLGNSRVRPFFSRRIGSFDDQPVPVNFGLRLSGKLNNDWRIGLMSMQTGANARLGLNSQNYGVAAIERKVGTNSSVVGFATNRQAFSDRSIEPTPGTTLAKDYNRIIGGEFNYRSKGSHWDGKIFLHKAFYPGQQNESLAYGAKMRYRTRVLSLFAGVDAVDEDFQTDLGFVPRLYHENLQEDSTYRIPYMQFRVNGYYRFYPESKHSRVAYFGPAFSWNLFTDHQLNYQEHDASLSFFVQWLNSSRVELSLNDYAPRLFFPFQLSGMDIPFAAGNYPGRSVQLDYRSDSRQVLFTNLSIGYGGEYLGRLLNLRGELNFRQQPWGVFGLNISYRDLSQFDQIYNNPSFTLIGSKIELSFSRNLFLTTYLQYNTQRDNFNVNARFQWRFQPMSDLFLVYTENYTALNFEQKNRAVVLKVNYWLNL
ncbi:MAG: DUF5916 domain-containing protein, partial [Bacteroidota bacterium]